MKDGGDQSVPLIKSVKKKSPTVASSTRPSNSRNCSPETTRSLKQGCVMSLRLCNVYMDSVVGKVNARVLGKWLLFADNIARVADLVLQTAE